MYIYIYLFRCPLDPIISPFFPCGGEVRTQKHLVAIPRCFLGFVLKFTKDIQRIVGCWYPHVFKNEHRFH